MHWRQSQNYQHLKTDQKRYNLVKSGSVFVGRYFRTLKASNLISGRKTRLLKLTAMMVGDESKSMGEENNDVSFLTNVIREVVNSPDDVQVTRSVDELGVLMTVKVNPSDMGLLIGRSGATAKAIRTLIRIVGMKNNSRINMKIEEPAGGRRSEDRDPRGYSGVGQTKRSVDDVLGDL